MAHHGPLAKNTRRSSSKTCFCIYFVGAGIAQAGQFVVLVPDFYHGKKGSDNNWAGHYNVKLHWDDIMADILAAVNYLKSHGCGKVWSAIVSNINHLIFSL